MDRKIDIDYNRISIYELETLLTYASELIDTLTENYGLKSMNSITEIKFVASEQFQRDAKIKYNKGQNNIVITLPESNTNRTKLAALLYIISKKCPAKTNIFCGKSVKDSDIHTKHKRGISTLQKSLDALL